jgi:hypothetical protein
MAEKSFLKMNFIGSPFELSKNLTNRSHFNTTRLNGKIRHYDCACVCNLQLQSRVQTHAVLVMGLYELLDNLTTLSHLNNMTYPE